MKYSGRILRARRAALGLTITKAAAKAGLKRTTWATMEHGTSAPSVLNLWLAAKALKLTALEKALRPFCDDDVTTTS